jgi:acyl-CoA synthetase (NDP forming)
MNVPGRVFAGFSSAFNSERFAAGGFSLVSQSGFGFGIAGMVEEAGVGLSKVVALGNAAGLEPADIVAALAEDPETEAIGLFVEGAGRAPRRLLEAARAAAAAGKPVLGWVAGQTAEGARAAAAHTAALAGDARLTRALLEEAGVVPVEDVADFADLARAFAPRRRPRGRRMAVVTISGGAGVAMVDEAARRGLSMAALAPGTTAALAEVVPPFGSTANPVDVTAALIAEPERLTRALDLVAADPGVDLVAVVPTVLQGEAAATVARAVADTAARTDKPVLASWCPRPGLAAEAHATLDAACVPNFPSPVRCVRAMAGLAVPVPAAEPPPAVHPLLTGPAETLAEHAAMRLLEQAGIPTARAVLARTAEEAAAAAAAIGARCALKVQSPDIPHKSDAGAVALDVAPADAAAAFARVLANARAAVPGAAVEGVLVQRMVRGGVEVILGARHDPAYGPGRAGRPRRRAGRGAGGRGGGARPRLAGTRGLHGRGAARRAAAARLPRRASRRHPGAGGGGRRPVALRPGERRRAGDAGDQSPAGAAGGRGRGRGGRAGDAAEGAGMIRDAPAQAARLAAARRLVEEVLIPAEPRTAADDRIPDEALAALRAHGLFGISIPEEHGGLGLTMEEEAELMLVLGRAAPAYRARYALNSGAAAQILLRAGTEAQRRRWLPGAATGGIVWASPCQSRKRAAMPPPCARRHGA